MYFVFNTRETCHGSYRGMGVSYTHDCLSESSGSCNLRFTTIERNISQQLKHGCFYYKNKTNVKFDTQV
jgi:hypothetical protein